jgi:hypothetical protein
MNLLSDIITYIRRIIKSPSNTVISDNLIIDYINRFWIMDVDARIQLFDLKTKYQFQTVPGYDQYNMPLYNVQVEPGPQNISFYPVYQGFVGPAYINGIQIPLQTQKEGFFNVWPNIVQQISTVAIGDGGPTYSFTLPIAPFNSLPQNPPFEYILRGHVDMVGIVATGVNQDPPLIVSSTALAQTTINPLIPTTSIFPAFYLTATNADGQTVIVSDSGQFLTGNTNYGLLMSPGSSPYGNVGLTNSTGNYTTTSNTVNYFNGQVNVTFPIDIDAGMEINCQCFYFQTGLPRALLFYNNTLTFRSPPDQSYLVEIDAYLSPAAFLSSSQSVPFAYMCEYIARGAARKILSDTGDVEQFMFYEPLFREQEMLVWKRSQRQFTASRTQTIYSQGLNQGQSGFNNSGGGSI